MEGFVGIEVTNFNNKAHTDDTPPAKDSVSSNATVIELEDLELIDSPIWSRPLDLSEYKTYSIEETEDVVSLGDHCFLNGMLQAYREHKSFTFSPDIIWLLIVQGFTRHIDRNHENLRSMFVSFEGKKTLIVERPELTPDTATVEDWNGIINEFVEKVAENTGKQLTDTLEPKFSTTTPTSHTAGCVSIMSAMKYYFEYEVDMEACGFPTITIEGTLEDWELIKQKVEDISKYDLKWWTCKLIPLIDEFINVKKGIVNKRFWLKMFRYKDGRGFYDPSYIDGWICDFFPYAGSRIKISEMQSEILTVPLKLKFIALGITVDCELHAGFMGVKETKTGFGKYNIKPVIGWGFKYDVPKPKEVKEDEEMEKRGYQKRKVYL